MRYPFPQYTRTVTPYYTETLYDSVALPFATLPTANSYDTSLYPDLPRGPAIPLWRNNVTKSSIKYRYSYFQNRM